MTAILAAGLGVSCSDSSPGSLAQSSPGLTFTYPRDGQLDIPIGARMTFQFTDELEAQAVEAPCAMASGVVTGGFCIVGPGGPIALERTRLGPRGNILSVTSTELQPGVSYAVYARPSLLANATNLPADQPLLHFRTRRSDSAAGAPQLLSVSGEDPRAFAAGGPALLHPVLDRSSLRLVFSEALEERSLVPGQSVKLRRSDAPGTPAVAATVLLQGQHLVVDPERDLEGGASYQLLLTGLTDRSGAPLPATTLAFTVSASPSYEQVVEIDLQGGSSVNDVPLSTLTGNAINSVAKHSTLIGSALLGVLPGTLRVELGDPSSFGGPIPFTLRKGQRLSASELPLKLAGVVGLGYHTGALYFDLIADANGWITRNPYRAAELRPDDHLAPLLVDLTFDAALTAEDPTGNALATQTILAIHLVGTATSVEGQLVIETAGTLEVELLGVTRSTADVSLRLRTGAAPMLPASAAPRIVATSPAQGSSEVAVEVRPQILISGAVDLGKLAALGELVLRSPSGVVPAAVTVAGGAVLVSPTQPLAPSTTYRVQLGALFDVSGRAIEPAPSDATGGTGILTFTTAATPGGAAVAPQLLAIVPGAPCPLTGGTGAAPGHCVGGGTSDRSYQPFELPADRPAEARFSQPISTATMRLGTACGRGAIRVEELDGAGACTGVVAGELTLQATGFRFTPSTPWTPGKRYRLSLVPGTDGTCGTDELCGANNRPFNSDPLNGLGSAGGPSVVIPFTATAATTTTLIRLATSLTTDRNSNGKVDAGEARQISNELAVDVASTSGIVSAAGVTGPDCQPTLPGNQVCLGVTADLPVTVLPTVASCPVDATGKPTTGAPPCVPIRISAQGLRTTSLTIEATATIAGQNVQLSNVQTEMMHLRLLENDAAGVVGHILEDTSGKPVFVIAVSTLMDAPDLSILAGLVSHDVQSKPINLTLGGPVTFLSDGRMQVVLRNRGDVIIPVNISAVLSGRINLRVPDGTLSLTLTTPPIR